jgi:hypothetical protein
MDEKDKRWPGWNWIKIQILKRKFNQQKTRLLSGFPFFFIPLKRQTLSYIIIEVRKGRFSPAATFGLLR